MLVSFPVTVTKIPASGDLVKDGACFGYILRAQFFMVGKVWQRSGLTDVAAGASC